MKNLIPFIHPSGDFLEEHKTSIKIQIDNSLDLGWKVEDILLATNFPYEYNGVRSLLVSDDNYASFCPTVSCINVIVELFERKLIEKDELYWFHDLDAYQSYRITESELDLGKADMALTYKGLKLKLEMGSIFFKSSAEDIFAWIKETANKYQANEEYVLVALYTNNLLWITETETDAQQRSVPMNIPGTENLPERIKTLNVTYNFWEDILGRAYEVTTKPIKVAHFHFSSDLILDSFMYGKNSQKKVLMPERLIKIFNRHGVKGVFPKIMKNVMVYFNSEKKFPREAEDLVERQIDNSLNLGWKKEDIILLTNFPYEYNGVKTTVVEDNLFCNVPDKAITANAIFRLLEQGLVKEAQLWWHHDLDVFQVQPIKDSEIDLEGTTAGITDYGYFFRKGSHKLFEWIRNRAIRLDTDETTALTSLANTNYRNINSLYKKVDGKSLSKIFNRRRISTALLRIK